MTSRTACRAKRRTKPARGEAAPRAFSGGIVLDGSVTTALSNRRGMRLRRALGPGEVPSLRHHFGEVMIILGLTAAHGDRTDARPV
jgi:hypothetical protein